MNLLNQNKLRKELLTHLVGTINDKSCETYELCQDELHHVAFNEGYYIIGYYQAKQWLNMHEIDTFDAIEICAEYENDNFGEVTITDNLNPESVVNLLVYILGEELLSEFDLEQSVEELKAEFCEDIDRL